MNIYQRSTKVIRESAHSVNEKLKSEGIRKVQRVTIIIFAVLIVLDVVFVLPNPFPTFSRLMLDSSPKYSFIIWLWGVITANIFFPRKVNKVLLIKSIGLAGIILISTALFIHGSNIANKSKLLECTNINTQPQPGFTEVICYNAKNSKIDCFAANGDCSNSKYDITTTSKLMLLIFGFVFGYLLWPQIERAPETET